MRIEVFDPNDDWVVSGALLDAYNSATFRLSSAPLEPDAYATFVAAPWVEVPSSPNGASLAGAYLPADPTYEFEETGINIAWFDTQDSHDGPATVLRLVIDVSEVEGADVSGGFGSVYFSQSGPAEPGDILVAGLQSESGCRYGGSALVPLSGKFYVKGK
jgi:hypothetical protein